MLVALILPAFASLLQRTMRHFAPVTCCSRQCMPSRDWSAKRLLRLTWRRSAAMYGQCCTIRVSHERAVCCMSSSRRRRGRHTGDRRRRSVDGCRIGRHDFACRGVRSSSVDFQLDALLIDEDWRSGAPNGASLAEQGAGGAAMTWIGDGTRGMSARTESRLVALSRPESDEESFPLADLLYETTGGRQRGGSQRLRMEEVV